MRKDHSPSQTYLKSFCDPDKLGYLNIYRKKANNTEIFYSLPKNVCYEKNGDLNNSFKNKEILREFLQNIEPKWPNVIKDLEEKKIKKGTIGIIDAYLAYLRLCSPVAKKCSQSLMAQDLVNISSFHARSKKIILDTAKSSLTEDQIIISQDFANAPAIRVLPSLSLSFSKAHHFILYNDTTIPFLTNDNPAIPIFLPEYPYSLTYCPLTPRISILLMPPDHQLDILHLNFLQEEDFYKATTNYSLLSIKDIRVQEYNSEIAKFAEDKIISNIRASWITNLVQQLKHYRTKIVCTRIKSNSEEDIYQYKLQANRN